MQIEQTNSVSNLRVASYAIQGFIYQFNKTLLAILQANDDAKITVEGLIEDIDITEPLKTTAIQCKYHEGQTDFKLSILYKPLLQMMDHFHRNPSASINYVLFAHFPDMPNTAEHGISLQDMNDVVNSSNKHLQSYVKTLKGKIDLSKFHSQFRIEFGPSLDNMVQHVFDSLKSFNFDAEDIPLIVYPNAIHFVANLSIKLIETDRIITKHSLLMWLHSIRKTTISRWTLALKSAKQILDTRRNQLKINLVKNNRLRYFLLSESAAIDFTNEVVLFIADFLDTYHYKPSHTKTPLFCLDCDETTFNMLRDRIYHKGITYNDGFIGSSFYARHFSRQPIIGSARDKSTHEFLIRLIRYQTAPEILNNPKCDDFFLITTQDYPALDLEDVNEERLLTTTFHQAKYLLGVSNDYE